MRRKIKLPVWVVVAAMFLLSMFISLLVSDYRMKSLICNMEELETMYIQETGKYPDWFLEWQNTVYLPKHMEE